MGELINTRLASRIRNVRNEVDKSGMELHRRDNLHEILDVVELGTNGVQDKVQAISESLLAVVLFLVENQVANTSVFGASTFRICVRWCRWPVTIILGLAILMGNAPDVIDAIRVWGMK